MNRDVIVKAFLDADVPILIWGLPGGGKTAWLNSLGENLGWPVETIIVSIRDVTDFVGLPAVQNGRTVYATPGWVDKVNSHPNAILFFDEISCATPATLAGVLRIIQERYVGTEKLHAGVRIVAAANPPECSAGGYDLTPPLANRMAHLEWADMYPVKDWLNCTLAGEWAVPGNVTATRDFESALIEARAMIGAFLTARPSHIEATPKDLAERPMAWPSRRSWTNAINVCARLLTYGIGWASEEVLDVLRALVGQGHAVEAVQYLRELDLPTPEEMLKNPKGVKLPERSDRIFAAMSAAIGHVLATLAEAKKTNNFKPALPYWKAALDLLERLNAAGNRDIAMSLGRLLLKHEATGPMVAANGGIPDQIKSFRPLLDAISKVV